MKKLQLMTAALLAALVFTGCQSQQAETTETRSAPTKTETSGVIYDTELMQVTKEHLSGNAVGQPITYRLAVKAKKNITNVQVTEMMSSEFDYVSSSPEATQEGDKYVWSLGTIKEGQSKSINVTVRPTVSGTYKVCSTFTADPILCLPLMAGEPMLAIVKSGPTAAELGDTITWDVSVTNNGNVTAPGVVLTDTLPEGMTAVGPTEFNLGDIAPGETRSVQVSATSSDTGNFTNVASTQYAGGDAITDDAPVQIVQSKVAIEKSGPEETYALVDERFSIMVENIGQTTLENVMVVDRLPPNTRVSNAGGGDYMEGADGTGGQISWNVGSISAGQSKTVSFDMTSLAPARTTNVAEVMTARGLKASDTAETIWKAVPGVRTSITDDRDPIRIGETTTYIVTIQNQSRLETIDASIEIAYDAPVQPTQIISGEGGVINGQMVTFDNIRLGPGEGMDIRIVGTGAESGNATIKMSTTTNFRTEPIRDEESTTVY